MYRNSVVGLVLLLVSCGGGGGSTSSPPPAVVPQEIVYDYRDYAPFRQSVTRTFSQGQFSSTVIDANTIDIQWGSDPLLPNDSVEEQRIRPLDGVLWVWLDAYRNTPYRWRSVATRAQVNYGQGWVDLKLGMESSLYSPVVVPAGGFTLRQWGCVKGDIGVPNADECARRWFHIHTITPVVQPVYNSCWRGVGDSNRLVLRQQEAWWDEDFGWLRGVGPLDTTNTPTGEATYEFFQDIARDAGYVWQGSNGLCLVK